MFRKTLFAAAAVAVLAVCAPQSALAAQPLAQATAGLQRLDGLIPLYLDADKGRVLMLLPAPDAEGVSGRYIHLTSLRTGLGSAPVGLDRGLLGDSRIIAFRRLGGKVAAEFENHRFRAEGAPAPEQAAARDAFAPSTVWTGEVISTDASGRVLVDISSLLTADLLGVTRDLARAGEEGWRQAEGLSLVDAAATKAFPENIELEARQTFTTDSPGDEVSNIAPKASHFTLAVRHSFIKLPEPGYQPLPFDQRGGSFSQLHLDFAAPLGQPIVEQVAVRFRLEKTDPTAAVSPVRKPIVFYMDRGAPEPIRSALMEGAGWWAQAFEAAGYQDAFRVELLPEGADPLDVRYNIINWADRATRGWSYGQAVTDPRTGEILKGSVVLGALRVRQDMLIFEGLVGADKVGTGGPNDPAQAALARLRQLGAHEVGHSIGLAHNFAASTQGRASVMDYPPPRIGLKDGRIDLSDAYATGIGAWDKLAVAWLYGPGGEAGQALLNRNAADPKGLRYMADGDARGLAVGQPWASLWDDGEDPAAELTRMLAVREVALGSFGLAALHPGEPVAMLRRKYAPIFLMHRYQIEAAGKLLGGLDYSYSVIGDGAEASPAVPAASQQQALSALLATLRPEVLVTPPGLLPLLSAGQEGAWDRQTEIEVFPTLGGPIFDNLAAAETAAGLTLDVLLNPKRLARLIEQNRLDPTQPGADQVLEALVDQVFADPTQAALLPTAHRTQARAVLDLGRLAANPETPPAVAALALAALDRAAARLAARSGDAVTRAHRARLIALIETPEELRRLANAKEARPEAPPGMPIGAGGWIDGDWGS
ncbi:MAG: zinc-dependent metalloprotease [Caulobacteraceae bacterium]|nr:zinc-dependent metalloprotease [Caulobacteraceae bacterium]